MKVKLLKMKRLVVVLVMMYSIFWVFDLVKVFCIWEFRGVILFIRFWNG